MPADPPTLQEPRAVLRIFNPRRLDDRALEDSFIARQEQFADIRSDILGTAEGKAPQHHLIIGQRGMGKTTLLCRIAVELRREENRARFLPLAFPEELHVGVDRLSDLWLACLDALADALEAEGHDAEVRALDTRIASLARPAPEEAAKAEACRAAFFEALAATGRRAVLLLDNFYALLLRLKAHDYTLRKIFSQPDAPLIIAASPLVPAEAGEYKAAFLEHFKVHHLYRLSLQEMNGVMRRLAEVEGRPELARRLLSEGPRLATLRDLTGGNPRTAVLLYRHFTRGFGADPYEDLEALLDDITALYQSRIDQLSDQAQKLIALIAQHWAPITAEKLTTLSALPRGSVTSQINRLLEMGMLEPVSLHGTKKTGYQIAERFLNVWFLMRHSTRRARGSIAALTRFLALLYTPAELRDMAGTAVAERGCHASRYRFHLALAHAMREHDGLLSSELSDLAQSSLAAVAEGVQDKLAEFIHPGEVETKFMEFAALKKKLQSLVPADCGVRGDDFAELILGSIFTLVQEGKLRSVLSRQSSLSCELVRRIKRITEDTNSEAEQMGTPEAVAYVRQRLTQGLITSLTDANEWSRTIAIAPSSDCCEYIGNISGAFGMVRQEVEAKLRKAELDPQDTFALNSAADLLHEKLQEPEKAEQAYLRALERDSRDDWARMQLLGLQRDILRKLDAARKIFMEMGWGTCRADIKAMHEALFYAHEDNWGLCAKSLQKGLVSLMNFSHSTSVPDDWCRASAVLLQLGFGEKLLTLLREEQADVRLLPWYEALAAHQAGDRRFLQNIPAEAKGAAEKLYDEIERRRAILRQAWQA